MKYIQYRLAQRDDQLVQQSRIVTKHIREFRWYKPWDFKFTYEYTDWKDIPWIQVK